MKRTKKQVINKILSFNLVELARWMKSRLHGEDKYFPINEGVETNLARFLTNIYENIKDKKFRDNFLEILDDLTDELSGYSREKIIKEAEYIHELLSLCAGIKQFENTPILYEIAVSGDLKGVKAFDMELHQLLLSTLASLNLTGDAEFWLEQMEYDTNKYYTSVAFYALLIRGYRLGIILKRIDLFIDRFKGEMELCRGIQSLFDAYGEAEIIGRFMYMDRILSWEQKEAVNNALIEIGNDPVYQLEPGGQVKMDEKKKEIIGTELTMLLIYLTGWEEDKRNAPGEKVFRAWKGYKFEVLDELQSQGFLQQIPGGKSLLLYEKGKQKALELLKKYIDN